MFPLNSLNRGIYIRNKPDICTSVHTEHHTPKHISLKREVFRTKTRQKNAQYFALFQSVQHIHTPETTLHNTHYTLHTTHQTWDTILNASRYTRYTLTWKLFSECLLWHVIGESLDVDNCIAVKYRLRKLNINVIFKNENGYFSCIY